MWHLYVDLCNLHYSAQRPETGFLIANAHYSNAHYSYQESRLCSPFLQNSFGGTSSSKQLYGLNVKAIKHFNTSPDPDPI
jgi:hypothetical protein